MKRYANDKYYYWRDEITHPKVTANRNEKDDRDDRSRLYWLFPLIG